MKVRKTFALLFALALILSLLPAVTTAADTYEFWDLRNADNITTETLSGTVDGTSLTVTRYTGWYAEDHNNDQQKINIYVPSNVTPDSAILLLVNNGGWRNDDFPATTIVDGFDYVTTGTSPSVTAMGLDRGFVIVSYGARSRANPATDGEYLGHSPATMTDTKAAVRFVRYNYDNGVLAGKGSPDRIVVTGTSGGGALSTIMAASGDSPDYFPSLYEIGAAGITYDGSGALDDPGSFTSDPDIGDSLFGTIAYCPITDLPMADQAYEWTYNAARTTRPDNANVNGNNVTPLADNSVMSASAFLAGDFTDYINGLGLLDEDGIPLTASYTDPAEGELSGSMGGSFRDAMQRLLEKGINKAIAEWAASSPATPLSNADPVDTLDTFSSWLQIDGEAPTAGIPAAGSVAAIYDLEAYLSYVASTSDLKIAPAFDNQGTQNMGMMNENNLVGRPDQPYSHWEEWSWDHADDSVEDVGLESTGLSWDEFLQTDDGNLVALQSKMTTPIPYLLGAENIPYLQYADSSDDCVVAPYWYVRHGEKDRDTSFAVGTLLYYSLLSNDSVKDLNFNFAWLKPHGGSYDTLEAFQWLDEVLAEEPQTYEFWDLRNVDNITTETLSGTVDGTSLTVTRYTGWYAEDHNNDQQKINIYVPSNVTPDSAILLLVNNGGWMNDNFPATTIVDGFDYVTTGTSPSVTAMGLDRGFVIVSYGARSRANPATDGEYLGHSPATMTDTKAAVRFVRYNYDNGVLAGKGSPDRIVVTGSSGGGALSAIMAASGDSPDYFPSLYEIGAAGITYDGSGAPDDPDSFTSDPDVGDSLFGTIAYCPITDLPMADQAYEWTYNAARTTRPANPNVNGATLICTVYAGYDTDGAMPAWDASAWDSAARTLTLSGAFPAMYDEDGTTLIPAKYEGGEWVEDDSITPAGSVGIITTTSGTRVSNVTLETVYSPIPALADNPVMLASEFLAGDFADYINGLGLTDEDGTPLTATFTPAAGTDDPETAANEAISGSMGGSFRDAMLRLLENGVNKAIGEWAVTGGTTPISNADPVDTLDTFSSWLQIDGEAPTAGIPAAGSVAAIYDLEAYLSYVASTSNLKIAPAFDNQGIENAGTQNENNLVGRPDQPYSHWEEWSWDHADDSIEDVGLESTGLSWDEFLQTDDGNLVALQSKMTTPIPYLLGAENIPYLQYADSSDDCVVAPYWYVRHGEKDRDTSFAVGTLLYYSLLSNDSVKNLNFNFAWLKPHGGSYDTLEAFQWLDWVLAEEPETYTITFDANGGSVTSAHALTGVDGTLNSLPTPTRSGYRFNGWYTAASGGTGVTTSTVFTGDTTIYAQWTRDSSGGGSVLTYYTVTFNSSGGSAVADRSVVSGGTVAKPSDPTRDGYTFTGWYSNAACTTAYDFSSKITGNLTLYAGWEKKTTNPFTDVNESDWYYDAVLYAYLNGLMTGTNDTTFQPDAASSRAMIVTVLWRIAGSPAATGTNEFTDLTQDWYRQAVQWAVENGITNGVSADAFGPDAAVTREQLAALLYRFAAYMGYDITKANDLSGYSDAGDIDDFAKDAMAFANAMGFLTGDTETTLSPGAGSTRAVLATVLMRLCEAYGIFE